jgi:hypothetical protein
VSGPDTIAAFGPEGLAAALKFLVPAATLEANYRSATGCLPPQKKFRTIIAMLTPIRC